jgi:hypothetical protein
VERNALVGDGVDEKIVVWRQGVAGREAEFVDIQVRRCRWERSVWRREDGTRVRLVFGFVRIWGFGMEEAAQVGFENVHGVVERTLMRLDGIREEPINET